MQSNCVCAGDMVKQPVCWLRATVCRPGKKYNTESRVDRSPHGRGQYYHHHPDRGIGGDVGVFLRIRDRLLSALVTLFTPLNFIFGKWKDFLARRFHSDEQDTVTEGELVTMVSEAEKDGEITDRESELIRSAISFDDVEVEDVLIPRVDVVAVADDVVEEVRPQSNGSWLIAGDAGVDDVAEELSISDKSKAVSISGLVQEKLGGLPKVGDHFRWGKYEGIVTRTTHRRVQEVRLTLMEPEAVPQE